MSRQDNISVIMNSFESITILSAKFVSLLDELRKKYPSFEMKYELPQNIEPGMKLAIVTKLLVPKKGTLHEEIIANTPNVSQEDRDRIEKILALMIRVAEL
jgi:hypothetical protein